MGPRGTWPDPEPVTGELVTCQPDCRLEALRLAVATAAGLGAAAVLRTARDYLDWLTARPQGVPPGDAAEIRGALATITKQLEAIVAAQDDVNAAVATDNSLLTDLSTQVAAVTAAQAEFAAEITALQGQGVDTTGLVAANAQLAAAQGPLDAAVTALTAAAAPPAPPTAPSGTSN